MDQYEFVEKIQRTWQDRRKEVLTVRRNETTKETTVSVAYEVGGLQVILQAVIGKRNGLRERFYLFDFTKQVVGDRIILSEVTRNRSDGHVLPLRDMRRRVRLEHEDPVEVCKEEIADAMSWHLSDSETSARLLRLEESHYSMSPGTVSGGLPNLGRR